MSTDAAARRPYHGLPALLVSQLKWPWLWCYEWHGNNVAGQSVRQVHKKLESFFSENPLNSLDWS